MSLAAKQIDWRSLPPEAKQQFLEELRRRQGSRVGLLFKKQYRRDPVAFVRDCFNWREGEQPAAYQDEILAELPARKRVTVRSPHGAGKTTLAAWIILWFALTRDGEDWKIPTTASSWRQLTKFLWPEIHKWTRKLKWDRVGRPLFDKRTELLGLSLKLFSGEAFACASDDPTLIEGAHADQLLYVFDEAKAIKGETFDAAEGAFSGGGSAEAFALAISTPGEPSGRFYDIHTRKPGYEDWTIKHITLEDAIASGRISREWAEQRKKQWGEKSAVFQNRVLGEFCATDEDSIIPLSWIEAANERWEVWHESKQWLPFTCVAADIGRSENGDKTSLALRHAHVATELRRYAVADTMISSGHVASILNGRGGYGVIDLIGVGAGVYDRLREQGLKVRPFNAGAAAPDRMRDRSGELEFLNLRAAAWWKFRELLDPAFDSIVCLPPDDLLTGDLSAPHWRMTSAGKVQVESKDEIRKRLGRSTDDGDSVVMAFFEEPERRRLLIA